MLLSGQVFGWAPVHAAPFRFQAGSSDDALKSRRPAGRRALRVLDDPRDHLAGDV